MKTTLLIHDEVMLEAKQAAARQGVTLSELVEGALRRMLAEAVSPQKPRLGLPTFAMGTPHIDPSNREALYQLFDREEGLAVQEATDPATPSASSPTRRPARRRTGRPLARKRP